MDNDHKRGLTVQSLGQQIYPLSWAQSDIFFHQQQFPNTPLYNVCGYNKLSGKLDVARFQQAFKLLSQSYDAFALRFFHEHQLPEQVLDVPLHTEMALVDLSDVASPLEAANQYNKSFFATRFDLSKTGLIQAKLLKLSDNEHWFVLLGHHLVLDGWGTSLVAKHLSYIYTALGHDDQQALEHLLNPPEFVDQINKSLEYQSSKGYERSKQYWLDKFDTPPALLFKGHYLADFTELEALPSKRLHQKLSIEHSEKLRQFAAANGVGIQTILLALTYSYFAKVYAQDELTLGITLHNRTTAAQKEVIGAFAATSALLINGGQQMSFLQLLAHIGKIQRQDFRHQKFPISHLNRALRKSDKIQTALFDLSVNYLKLAFDDGFEAIQVQTRFLGHEYSQLPLAINLTEFGNEKALELQLDHNLAYFSEAEARLLMARLVNLLEQILQHPELALEQYQYLPDQELALIAASHGKTLAIDTQLSIGERFEQFAASQPDADFVITHNQRSSYKTINAQANRLARYLQSKGIGRGDRVGICLDANEYMPVALLAVFKLGCAYVPLDATFVRSRLEYMIEDAKMALLLTCQEFTGLFAGHQDKLLLLDSTDVQTALKLLPEHNLNLLKDFDTKGIAYLIYTSGSTGQPKGVMVSQRNLLNYVGAIVDKHQLAASMSYGVLSTLATDLGNTALYLALLTGGKLHLMPQQCAKDAHAFADYMQQHQVDVLKLTPNHFDALYQPSLFTSTLACRYLFLGGEALLGSAFEKAVNINRQGQCQVINHYGPTEATIGFLTYPLPAEPKYSKTPIGTPLANTVTAIVDANGHTVPVGVVGELYVGGAGVTQGYFNRDELTAERFITWHNGDVMYRTGDLVRLLSDGNIEFAGRNDDQVKIRGFRVELGEIEHHLSQLMQVEAAVVQLCKDNMARDRLVAFVILNDGEQSVEAIERLKVELAQTLPAHMMPDLIQPVAAFKLQANGKVDRKALPQVHYFHETGYVAPQNEQQTLLVEHIAQLLNVPHLELSVTANFFELGGDSIISIQLVARVRQQGWAITGKDVFDAPNIRALANLMKPIHQAVTVPQHAQTGQLPLLPIQRLFFNDETELHHYNQSVLLTTPANFKPEYLPVCARLLYQRHDALRIGFSKTNGGWTAAFETLDEQIIAASIAQITLAQTDFSGLEAEAEAIQASLSLDAGGLFKMVHFVNQRGEGRLLLVCHHLVIDGVSWRVVLEDLESIVAALNQGEQPKLAQKTASVKDWAEYLLELSRSDALLGQKDYWLAQQSSHGPMPLSSELNFVTEAFTVDEATTAQLLHHAGHAYHTQVNELLLAALFKAYLQWSAELGLTLNLEGHGRESQELDLSQTLGWFTSLFPLTLSTQTQDWRTLVCNVKEAYRQVPWHGLGFGVLKYLTEDPQIVQMNTPELVFNYLGQFDQVANQGHAFAILDEKKGASVSPLRRPHHSITINGMVNHNVLQMDITFDAQRYAPASMNEFKRFFVTAIKELVAHCISCETPWHSPSDFPLAKVTPQQLNKWQRQYAIADLYPATAMQQGLIYHSQQQPRAYSSQKLLRFGGKLDEQIFRAAWQHVLEQHEVLRTVFVWDEHQMHQLVPEQAQLPWQAQNIANLSAEQQHQTIEAFIAADALKGFKPDVAPLMRLCLWRLGDTEHALLWTGHHALTDGWCNPLIVGEVLDAYHRMIAGVSAKSTQARPYRDYIAWLADKSLAPAREYWHHLLADIQGPTPLPYAQSTHVDEQKDQFSIELTAEHTKQWQTFARGQQVTLNVLLQSAWGYLLSLYSGESSVVFGTTVSGRPAELEQVDTMVGLFIKTLPVRMDIDSQTLVGDWLKQSHKQQHEREAYAELPLTEIHQLSGVSAGRPLFNALVVVENYPPGDGLATSDHSKAITLCGAESFETRHYDMTLVVMSEQQLSLSLKFNPHKIRAKMAEQWLRHFTRLIDDMQGKARMPLGQLTALSAQEASALTVDMNAHRASYPVKQCLHELFEQQVQQWPNKVAVTYAKQSITYAELNAKANRLAHYLREQGVGPDTLVGLCLERGIAMIATILAVLKAGGAYVPIDPQAPKERVEFIAQDSGILVLITDDVLAEIHAELDGFSHTNLSGIPGQGPANLAYVIYTSGSTGKPKGVLVEHRQVVRLFSASKAQFGFNPSDVWSLCHSYGFDFSVWEIWGALLHGGRLLVVPAKTARAYDELYQLLVDEQVTVFNQTPSAFSQFDLVDRAQAQPLALRYVIFGGEALNLANLEAWAGRHGDTRPELINMYGITETTVHVTYRRILSKDIAQNRGSLIGPGLADLSLYILDANLNPVPIGAPGEMYVGGDGVTRGYLNRDELTLERFIDNPYEPGARLYRTGDLARYLDDGEIEYLGRIDSQVKIRGHRIELGEIEQQLLQLAGIDNAVVLADKGTQEHQQLVAYLLFDPAQPSSISAAQEHLRTCLPDYMQPSYFVELDELPLTVNGKIDVKALPEPDVTVTAVEFEAPNGVEECLLADIWAELIGIDVAKISRHAGFFELGGHSLLSLRLLAQIQNRFKLSLQIRDLFEQPTLAALAGFIQSNKSQVKLNTQVKSQDRHPLMPVSFAQQRMWLVALMGGDNGNYNICGGLILEGQLQTNALSRAFGTIVARHESLRTVFVSDDEGQVHQQVKQSAQFDIDTIDLSGAVEPEAEFNTASAAFARAPFDLSKDLMLRVRLYKLADQLQVMMVSMHHIAADGWSLDVLIKQFSRLYQSYASGQEEILDELEVQYADYAHWQRNWLQGEVLQNQLGYWLNQLSQLPVVHNLPLDSARPAVQTFNGAVHQSRLPVAQFVQLKQACREVDASLFMGLQTVFSTLLARLGNESDIVMGTAVANREQAEVAELIGLFVNTLVLRSDLSGALGFADLLAQNKRMLLDAYSHQQVPFELLVEHLNPERSSSHSPLFQVMLLLQNQPQAMPQLPQLTVTELSVEHTSAKFDLTLTAVVCDSGLTLNWEYNTDLFKASSIEQMAGIFNHLCAQMLAQPEQDIWQLPLLTDEQTAVALSAPTEAEQRALPWVHQRFEQVAEQSPNAIALVYGEDLLSYDELNRQANRLAHYLVNHRQVVPGDRVGICLNRDMDMVVAILAVLKAGAAYVPLDPKYPDQRLGFMAEDAQLSTILSSRAIAKDKPFESSQLIYLGHTPTEVAITGCSDLNLDLVKVHSQMPAYVIYTSGTTGKPKGVVVSHQSWSSYAAGIAGDYGLQLPETVLQFSSLSFDILIEELSMSLLSGGTLALSLSVQVPSAAEFWQRVSAANVTVATLPTAYWHQLCSDEQLGKRLSASSLKLMIIGGEALNPVHLRHWQQHSHEGIRLLNTYGPTEATVVASFADVTGFDGAKSALPIGKACSDTRLYVLDDNKHLVPDGIVGQLYIAGQGVASGYLNQAKLSQERFVPNPYKGKDSSDIWYKTGDLVRKLPCGNLIFVGRMDNQVKIRGFRIELDEVRQQLCTLAGVEDAVVLVKSDGAGQPRIVAYLVEQTGTCAEHHKQQLASLLPEYMVPSVLISITAIPLTVNGKLDVKALPEVDLAASKSAYQAPVNETQARLCEIWQQLLGLAKVGINDNFFELGGHSLLATRLMAKIDHDFSVSLKVEAIFNHQSIAQLALLIAQSDEHSLPKLQKAQASADWPLSYAQKTMWLSHIASGNGAAYNMSSALKFEHSLELDVLEQAYQALLAKHAVLRTGFELADVGEPVQRIYPVEQLTKKVAFVTCSASQMQQHITQNAEHVFDLTCPPLFNVTLLQLDNGENLLLVNLHHIICDGWSVNQLINEFNDLYEQFSLGQEVVQARTPLEYVDYCVWQQDIFAPDSGHRQNLLQYWMEHLDGAPRAMPLPTDSIEQRTAGRGVQAISLSKAELEDIKALARQTGGTLFSLLLSGLNLLLAKWTGEQDVVVGTVVAGREQAQVEAMVGCFINILTLRTGLNDQQSLLDVVKATNQTVLQGLNHQALPFDLLVEAINPERSGGQNPLNNVSLRLQNQQHSDVSLCGGQAQHLEQHGNNSAQLALMFEAVESKDGLTLSAQFDAGLFERQTIEQLLAMYRAILNRLSAQNEVLVSSLALSGPLKAQRQRYQKANPSFYVCATFTAEPIEQSLTFWAEQFRQTANVQFAPYNQVFQQLLDGQSGFNNLSDGTAVLMLRWQDLLGSDAEAFEHNGEHFLNLLASAVQHKVQPVFVMSCPPSEELDQRLIELSDRLDQKLLHLTETMPALEVILADECLAAYPVSELHDPFMAEQAKIPYTQSAFSAFGSMIYRRFDLRSRRPLKVIVLDCDNTLWHGVCGEVGPLGIKITEPFARLQRFMLQQYHKGVVLCLNSKNNPEDVQAVFDQNPDMILSMEHIVVPKVNWMAKSQNIQEIAQELNLGLDSFVFVDDDSVQCAEVSARLPQVLTLQLPKQIEQIGAFIENVWVFDHPRAGATGAERSKHYKADRERQQLQQSTFDLTAFLHSLELQIDIEPISAARLKRASEMSLRTNQFNLTTIRHSESQLQALLAQQGQLGFSVKVADKFGDYGYVGIVLAQVNDDAITATDFMLSCRAMGRGVEHAMVRHLGELASARGLSTVALGYRQSAKNQPALNFLQSIDGVVVKDNKGIWQLTTEQAKVLSYSAPSAGQQSSVRQSSVRQSSDHIVPSEPARTGDYALIADRLANVCQIHEAVEQQRPGHMQGQSVFAEYVEPGSDTERQLCAIWQSLLGLERIGALDNFFDLGGHSLLATRLITEINRQFGIKLNLEVLFSHASIAAQAQQIEQLQLIWQLQNHSDEQPSDDEMELTL